MSDKKRFLYALATFVGTIIGVGILLIGWEVYEKIAHLPEPWTNTITDLIFGFGGIWLAYTRVPFSSTGGYNAMVALGLLVLWGSLNLWGWSAWRAHEFERLPAEKTVTTQATSVPE